MSAIIISVKYGHSFWENYEVWPVVDSIN